MISEKQGPMIHQVTHSDIINWLRKSGNCLFDKLNTQLIKHGFVM